MFQMNELMLGEVWQLPRLVSREPGFDLGSCYSRQGSTQGWARPKIEGWPSGKIIEGNCRGQQLMLHATVLGNSNQGTTLLPGPHVITPGTGPNPLPLCPRKHFWKVSPVLCGCALTSGEILSSPCRNHHPLPQQKTPHSSVISSRAGLWADCI